MVGVGVIYFNKNCVSVAKKYFKKELENAKMARKNQEFYKEFNILKEIVYEMKKINNDIRSNPRIDKILKNEMQKNKKASLKKTFKFSHLKHLQDHQF